MNIFFLTLIIFVLLYLILNWFVKTSSAKISKSIRTFTIVLSLILAVIMAYVGRFIFSLPFILMILPLIKTKVGLNLLQIFRIWSLLRILKNSGRFNFNNINTNLNTQSISTDEAYRILNLDPKKKYNKDEVLNSYKKIMKKIHPDVSPELTRLASIVNEAKEVVLKDIG
ncbi:MAG: molecular chaperone DnaJ [Pelagibacterales bacterium]|nr:molecular chaperone DnaJ [Pelagibacterales bacterium]